MAVSKPEFEVFAAKIQFKKNTDWQAHDALHIFVLLRRGERLVSPEEYTLMFWRIYLRRRGRSWCCILQEPSNDRLALQNIQPTDSEPSFEAKFELAKLLLELDTSTRDAIQVRLSILEELQGYRNVLSKHLPHPTICFSNSDDSHWSGPLPGLVGVRVSSLCSCRSAKSCFRKMMRRWMCGMF